MQIRDFTKPFAGGSALRPVFKMRQLVFIGFFCGPLALGIAVRQTMMRLKDEETAKKVFLIGLGCMLVELVLFAIAPINLVYFHLATGVLGKLAYDRWVMRPALRFQDDGGYFAGTFELIVFVLCFLLLAIPFYGGLALMLGYSLGML